MPELPHANASSTPEGPTASPSLFVATLFEDEAAAAHAGRLMSRILQMAGHPASVQEYTCDLHLLDLPDGPASAARRVASADVLVVATYHDSPTIQRVADWLKYWLAPLRKKPGALVAVALEQLEVHPVSAHNEERLSSVAAQINMKFFSTRLRADAEFVEDNSSPRGKKR